VIVVLQQMDQQVEHLRLHRHKCTRSAQLASIRIKDMTIEAKFHARYRIFSQETIKSAS
jgi:hypothetical protein